ncbi:FERM, ARHGEF and pleckstrin domain-containing protein 2-like isoform X2 [Liolophura sinensis]|uniref:FERM, ARHGEF and pleckstrin domain-containing protein 2-like isoform X2 n=1 Tax=Liolophura sinensis TaxID=3198878 RepID=UPI0031587743
MSDPNSPMSPRKGKVVNLRVHFLDSTLYTFQIPIKATGQALWDAVCKHIQLVEADYFDLAFTDEEGLQCWIDRDKPILKQIPSSETPLQFLVKFYTPDPALLEDEYTRYLFALQIKHDLASGLMTCSENTAALLASYIAQADIGDFLEEDYVDHTYLSNFKYVPNQNEELEKKIMDYHKAHIGQSPAEADINMLDTARKVELYGIRMHLAKDHEGVPLNLAVAHMGVLVFQSHTKINTFSWAIIRKLSFKRKKFLIKLHPDSYGYYKDTVEFYFPSRNECKVFWKKCLEHHAFFRCHTVKKLPRNKTRVVSRGSSFRYSGKTQKQLMEYVRENYVKRSQFESQVSTPRSPSASGRVSCRSTSVTPKIPAKTSTLNSSDLQNSTASSGSHILDTTPDTPLTSTRVETAEVHSDSSMSGSRSLGSPKLDSSRKTESGAEDRVAATPDSGDNLEADLESREQPAKRESPADIRHVGTSSGGFKMSDRKFSAPVLGTTAAQAQAFEQHIARCDEVENIPEVVEDTEEILPPPMHRKMRNHSTGNASLSPTRESDDDLPPPPPPPPICDEDLPGTPVDSPYLSYLGRSVASNKTPSSNMSTKTEDSEDDPKRKLKRTPMDRSYFIAKELLMTERTYKKDMEVLTVHFRHAVTGDDLMPRYLAHLLFSLTEPIYEYHCNLLKDIDARVSMWEGKSNAHLNGDCQRIGDILLKFTQNLEMYRSYLYRQEEVITELDQACKKSKKFEAAYKKFEGQKVCYLPLNTFLLKPGQRLLHYKLLLERLVKHYQSDHVDVQDSRAALAKLMEVTSAFSESMRKVDNLQKLVELQRDLVGIDSIVSIGREFLREGCLQKFSKKGYQQRMFFLFSDMLVYTSRTATPLLQFKVHGQLPLRGMIVDETDNFKMAVENSFTIYGGNRCLLVAASTPEEKDKWIEDLNEAVQIAKSKSDDKLQYASLKSSASSSENVDGIDGHEESNHSPSTPEKQIQHRANTTMHVCWHRNTSVSMRDHERAIKNQLSGYLLRKFKNSNGWQKLWVVFTNFCLFFYKTYQDDYPLASLPLLGYAVSTPDDEDGIHKDNVYKLQFKNHVYFFRADSQYTFERWVEVINSATSSARRLRLFSRLESEHHQA